MPVGDRFNFTPRKMSETVLTIPQARSSELAQNCLTPDYINRLCAICQTAAVTFYVGDQG